MSERDSLVVVDKPDCAEECHAVLLGHWRRFGIEAIFSWMPPLVDSGYEPLDMTCPHGVKWYGEPTTEQIAAWARDGVA